MSVEYDTLLKNAFYLTAPGLSCGTSDLQSLLWACGWVHAQLLRSCLTLCDPMGCNQPGFSVHGILQARILEWVSMPSSRGSSQPRGRFQVSCIADRLFTTWATREAHVYIVVGVISNLEIDGLKSKEDVCRLQEILQHSIQGTGASMDFGILDGRSRTPSPIESQGQLNKHSSHSKGKFSPTFISILVHQPNRIKTLPRLSQKHAPHWTLRKLARDRENYLQEKQSLYEK